MKKTSTVFWIIKKIRRRIPAILIMTFAHIGQALLGVAFALGTKNVIDAATSGIREDFLSACIKQGAIIAGVLLCTIFYRHLHDTLSAELDRDWKRELLNGILHGDYPSVSAFHSAELINRLNNDVRTINDGVLAILPNLSAMAARLASAAAVLITLEPLFGGAAIICGLLFVSITAALRKPLKAIHKKVSAADGKVSGIIQESIEKLLMIQSMDVASEMEKRTDELLGERFSLQRKRKNLSLVANTGISFLSQMAGFIALVWCSFNLLNGNMTFGELTAVTQLVSQLQMPLVGISGIIPQYIAMAAAAERIMEIEAIEREPSPMEGEPSEIYSSIEKISAENLAFSYGRETVFENLSFSLEKGSFCVVLGPSGSGKSTLLKLMLGVLRPESGEIFFGTSGEKIPMDRRTRRLFAYVPQGNLLLSGTLRENLVITNPTATEEEISLATYVSAMDDYIGTLPNGLDTLLGENGSGLSEGQAQRLAIARAVLCGSPILLLDECTSALDSETEIKVLERLHALPDKTFIAVTHRPAASEIADSKIIIEK
ncbi:MAG: ATP-binding cassette domain-containing protein [Oscillospiraceae bacterium]|nr:ATP-binding cassette domain-containing protein [Oscillospiraceae bacterium]